MVVDGQEYPVDRLVYATGFEVGLNAEKRTGYPTYGRDGLTPTKKWKDGAATLHGLQSHGYPNCLTPAA